MKRLFGHEKGSFTGAITRRLGCFELADHGTLLLDEIGDMPLTLQAKLLRVLEDRRVRRLGSADEVAVDVRVIASTNKNPEELIPLGKFREDLYFRLGVLHLAIPALRNHLEDLPGLCLALTDRMNAIHGTRITGIDPPAMNLLGRHNWPGNVRELRNVIERATVPPRRVRSRLVIFPQH